MACYPTRSICWKLRQCWTVKNAPAPHKSQYVLQYHPCIPPIMRKERMLPLKVQGRSWHLQLPSLLSLSWEDIMYCSFPTFRRSATYTSTFKIKISQSKFLKMLMIRIGLQNRLNFCNTLGTFLPISWLKWIDWNNLSFNVVNRQQYEKRIQLLEGNYKILESIYNCHSYNMLCELDVSLIMWVFAAFYRSTHKRAQNHTQTCSFACRHQRNPNARGTKVAFEVLSNTSWVTQTAKSFTEDYRNAHVSKPK